MMRIAVILASLALAGCGAEGSQAQAVDAGTEFTLAQGATASVKAADVKLRFVSVIEDSRCPRDTTCVWAGEVRVQLEIQEPSRAESPVEVLLGSSSIVGAYRVTLVRVEPEPVSTSRISPQDYRVTLVIEKES